MEEWLDRLDSGDADRAWDLFLSRYRRLIFATIGQHAHDADEVMDLFADVCVALRADGLARLRRYCEPDVHQARFSTWLVVVVRNLVIDRLRAVHGRPRLPAAVERLPPLQRRIYDLVFLRGHGHREAYEVVRGRLGDLGFGAFLKELAAVYRAIRTRQDRRAFGTLGLWPAEAGWYQDVDEWERAAIVDAALAHLPTGDAATVRLYVMEGLSAAEVARLLGLPDTKAVYNRVYRALAALRSRFHEAGYQRAADV